MILSVGALLLFAWYGLSCQEIPVTCAEHHIIALAQWYFVELSFFPTATLKKNTMKSHTPLCAKRFFFKSGHMMLLQVISTNQCKIIFLPLWYIRIFPCLLTLYARIFMQRNIHLNFSKVNTSCQLSRKKRGRSFSCPPTCAQDGYCQCVLQYEWEWV